MTLSFTVFGEAIPQGSAKAFQPRYKDGSPAGRIIVTSDNPRLRGWRQLVAESASAALEGTGWHAGVGAITLTATFYLPRPKVLGTKTKPHLTRPDVDKLARAVGDALTGVCWHDDSQVVDLRVQKVYAGVGESPRAEISIAAGQEALHAAIGAAVKVQHPLFAGAEAK